MRATHIRLICSLLLLADLPGRGGELDKRPSCNADQLGRFWPASANDSRQSVYELSKTGELELCTRGIFRYRWEALTVSYKDLLGAAKQKSTYGNKSHNTLINAGS